MKKLSCNISHKNTFVAHSKKKDKKKRKAKVMKFKVRWHQNFKTQ